MSCTTRTHKTTAVYTYTDGNITCNSAETSHTYIYIYGTLGSQQRPAPSPRQAQQETIPTGSGRQGEKNCSNGVNLPPNHPAVLGPRRFEEETAPSVVLLLPSPSPSPPIPASAFLRMYLFRRTPSHVSRPHWELRLRPHWESSHGTAAPFRHPSHATFRGPIIP